ncbi:MAG TPA: hypothetical protein VMR02_04405 [Terracidiphilus sp.]|jgi:hypothetical protein|nr:hypothetical protein [Terracidiphilus sp.]
MNDSVLDDGDGSVDQDLQRYQESRPKEHNSQTQPDPNLSAKRDDGRIDLLVYRVQQKPRMY